jgi:hypothetical protein
MKPVQSPSNSTEQRLASRLRWHELDHSEAKVASIFDDGELGADEISNCLSPDERIIATGLGEPDEIRHFIMRRAFQRCFLKSIINHQGPPVELALLHARDLAPQTPLAPHLSLSFSSSGKIAVAAASSQSKLGIDIEIYRPIPNALELAKRFFHADEAAYVAQLPVNQQSMEFQRFWVVKEACLKAIGKGVIYGPEKFKVSATGTNYHVDPPKEFGTRRDWKLDFVELSSVALVALVQMRIT